MNNPYGNPAPLDLVAIARWNYDIKRSREDYYSNTTPLDDYRRKIAAAESSQRHRDRQKAAK